MNNVISRTLIGALLAGSVSSSASAQVELIAGWNLGQFVGFGSPTTSGSSFTPADSIPSNFSGNIAPQPGDSGPEKFLADDSVFSAGTGVLSYAGWALGTAAVVVELGSYDAINGSLVNGLDLNAGDPNNAHLRFISGAVTDFTITVNTSAFADFDPIDFAQPNDANFTLSAYKGGGAGAVSIEWFFNGSSIGTVSTSSSTFVAASVDLPAAFYGQSSAVLTGRVTGDIVIDNLQINGVAAAIPEPASVGALAALASLALAGSRRRRA
jgi:hypothetical protein